MNKWETLYSDISNEINILDKLSADELHVGASIGLKAIKERMDDLKNEEQKGCEHCTKYSYLLEHLESGESTGRVFDNCFECDESGWHVVRPWSFDLGIKFCPYCGRELLEVEDDKTSL